MSTLTAAPELQQQLRRLAERLVTEFAAMPRGLVSGVVVDLAESFRDARVTLFVPVLIESEARRRLRALAADQGKRG